MNCRKVQSLISAFIDSELSGGEMLAIRSHFRDCPECRELLDSLTQVKKALGALRPKCPASDLPSRICRHLDEGMYAHTHAHSNLFFGLLGAFPVHTRWTAAGLAVLAILLILFAGHVSYKTQPDVIPATNFAFHKSFSPFTEIPSIRPLTITTLPEQFVWSPPRNTSSEAVLVLTSQ